MRSGVVLEKVCEYLYYNQKHAESKDVSDMDIPPELCLELLIAADYLDGRLPSCLETLRLTHFMHSLNYTLGHFQHPTQSPPISRDWRTERAHDARINILCGADATITTGRMVSV